MQTLSSRKIPFLCEANQASVNRSIHIVCTTYIVGKRWKQRVASCQCDDRFRSSLSKDRAMMSKLYIHAFIIYVGYRPYRPSSSIQTLSYVRTARWVAKLTLVCVLLTSLESFTQSHAYNIVVKLYTLEAVWSDVNLFVVSHVQSILVLNPSMKP